MDMLQLIFGFVNAPLFATFLHGLAVGTRVLGFNVNLVWGAVMVAFGGISLYLARSDSRR